MKDSDYLISWNKDNLEVNTTEVLVLGSGIAGLFSAIKISEMYDVTILTKNEVKESNTEHAQGGIAVALSHDDSPEFHYGDTINAGAGLCNLEAVKILAENGPECVRELIELGTQFDKHENQLAFTKEAAHSRRRVLHANGDATGEEIERALVSVVHKKSIKVKENYFVIDLLKNQKGEVCGVLALDNASSNVVVWLAKAVILATGGLGQLYKYTTNPEVTTGDGIAAAYRAGAELMDMEFIQFHPTALFLPGAPSFLLSEAARGEGARLLNSRGERFMEEIPGKDLAPRDVVARAIWKQMKEGPVYLDFSSLGLQARERFPGIYKTCLKYGIDMSTTPVPIAPAAHYLMGGIRVNTAGETNLPNLYACGECACNGVHGANRLASNSLLDGLVFAVSITKKIKENVKSLPKREDVQFTDRELVTDQSVSSDSNGIRNQLREIMWKYVGIIRDREGLEEAQNILKKLREEFVPELKISELELGNMLTLGLIITRSALEREESRGGHFRKDFPQASERFQKHTVLKRGEENVSFVSI